MNEYIPRPWGGFRVLISGAKHWVKELSVAPHSRTSLQSHVHRGEVWVVTEGEGIATVEDWPRTLKRGDVTFLMPGSRVEIPAGAKHRLENTTDQQLRVIEIAFGDYLLEEDIVRYSDDYGRCHEKSD